MTTETGAAVDRDRPHLGGADPAAEFRRLFDSYAKPLHRYLARRVGADTAHDLVSETFLVALMGRHGYDPGRGAVRSWLYGGVVPPPPPCGRQGRKAHPHRPTCCAAGSARRSGRCGRPRWRRAG